MLEQLGTVADKCDEYEMPFIAMMYPRGENIRDPTDRGRHSELKRSSAASGKRAAGPERDLEYAHQ